MDEDIPSHVLKEIAESCGVTVDAIQHVYTCTPLQVGTMAQVDQRTYSHTFVFSLEPSLDKQRFSEAVCRVVADNSVLRTRIVSCELGLRQVVVEEELQVTQQPDGLADYLKELESFQMHLHDRLLRIAIVEDKFILVAHHAIVDSVSLQAMINDVSRVYHEEPTTSHAEFSLFTDHCRTIDEEAAKSFWMAKFHGQPGVFPATKPGYTPEASQQIHKQINHKASLYKVESSLIPSYIQVAWGLTVASYLNTDNVAYGLVYSGRTPATLKGLESTLGPHHHHHPDPDGASEAAAAASRFTTLLNILARDDDAAYGRDLRYEYEHGTRSPYSLGLATFDEAVLPRAQMERVLCQFEHILQLLVRSPKETVVGRLPLVGVRDRREMLGWNTGTIPDDNFATSKCLHELFGEQARARPDEEAIAAHDGSLMFAELDELSGALAQGLRQRGVVSADETAVALLFEKSVWATVAQLGVLKAGGVCVPIDPGYPAAQRTAIIASCDAKLLLTSTLQHGEEGNGRDLLPISTLIVDRQTISDLRLPTLSGSPCPPMPPSQAAFILFTSGSTGAPKGVVLEHRNLASSLLAFGTRLGWTPGVRVLQFAASVWGASIIETLGTLLAGGCVCVPSDESRASGLADYVALSKVECAILTPTVIRLFAPRDMPTLKTLCSAGEAVDVEAARTWAAGGVRFFNGWGQSETSVCSSLAEWPSGGTSPYPHSIGTPVGCAIWIADEADISKLAPIGAVGQLVIEGPGVTRGYLRDEAKTKGSFIPPQPWTPKRQVAGLAGPSSDCRLYRTGDLARYYADGSIEYIGRQSSQVKVRGQRFDLQEVEKAVVSHAAARGAFAMVQAGPDGQEDLVAVLTLSGSQFPRGGVLEVLTAASSNDGATAVGEEVRRVREYLAAQLPGYMVPTAWLVVQELPRTASAKLDRNRLREWVGTKDLAAARVAMRSLLRNSLTPPATAMEKVLHSSWAAVLSIPEGQIGRESSLLRLGADSVAAMRIASLCRRSGVLVTVATLLRSATLADAAAAGEWLPKFGNKGGDNDSIPTDVGDDESLDSSKSSLVALSERQLVESENPRVQVLSQHLVSMGIPVSGVQSVLPCTSMQDGILFAQVKGGEYENDAYWNTSRIKLSTADSHRDGVDPHRLAKAWQALCDAQPILRTFFLGSVSDPACAFQQVVLKDVAASISQGPVKSRLRPGADFPKPDFAPAQPPHHLHLTRVSRYVVYATIYINHALMDERSMAALGELLRQAYADASALAPGPDLSEYVAWDRCHRASAREYWTRYLSGVEPCLVPVSAMRVSSKSTKPSSSFHDAIPRRGARSVHDFCKQQGITLANLVQVAWGLVLKACTAADGDSSAVCFGSILSQQSAVERGEATLGPLLAMVICSLDVSPNTVVSRLLERARDDALAVLENGGCPMSEMHDQLGMGQDAPLFNTAMTIARTRAENVEGDSDMKMEYLDVEENPTEYPLTIGVGYDQDTYGARIWCDETKIPISYAAEVGTMFATALNSIMEHPGQSVQALTARLGKPTTAPTDVLKSLEHSVGYESSITSTWQDLCSNTPSASSVGGTGALSDTEAELRQLWSQVLSVPADSIERTGNFFDLGGNSIRAMRLVNNARETHLSLTVADVFKTPVLSDLATVISRPPTPNSSGMSSLACQDPVPVPAKDLSVITAAPDVAGTTTTTTPIKELHRLAELASQHHCFHHDNIESVVPVTDAQAFMLAVSELDGKSLHNKAVIKLSKGLDTTGLARACEQVVQRQALLRTIFVQEGGRLYQAVLRSLPVRTVTFRGDDAHHVQPKGIEEARYLPRFRLQTDNPEDSDSDGEGDSDSNSSCNELHLHIHHVLYDAISLGLVLQDLRAAYMGEEGGLLSDTPKFSDWVLQVGSSSSSSSSPSSPSSSDDYWRQLLRQSSMTTLSPPTLPVRGATRTRTVAFRTQTRNLKTRRGLPSSALNAAWAAALYLATGSRDLVFGAANANRSSGSFPHAFQVPGPCLNLLPVRATLQAPDEGMTMTFGSLIEQLQDQATSGIPHQHVGFRSIARRCTDWPSWTRLGSVLVYQNYEAAGHSMRFGNVEADFSGEGSIGDSTDFWIIAKPVITNQAERLEDGDDGDLDIEILYSPHRASEEQARWVGRCLESVLAAIPTLLDDPLESFRKLVDGPVPSHIVPAVAVPEPVAMPTTPSSSDDARPRHPPPTRRRANTVLASVSAILEQPLDSFRKLGAADGSVTPPNPIVPVVPSDAPAATDGPVVANTPPKITTAIRGGISDARSAPQTPNRRRAHSVLESVSTLLKQPLESFQNLIESPTSTPIHVRAAAAAAQPVVLLSDGDEASSRDGPKKQARSLVALAWGEVGLPKGGGQDRNGEDEGIDGNDVGDNEDDDVSLFDCGGDLETVLLLSWWYRYRGHGVSMYDIIENPTRRGQWELLRKGLTMG
ncbi:Nonribosomal peptide synthetase 12 [Apiospora marii]|uniref:Nonribosomal peptide synthetase 12 n=1 Tax=Apiospora marii TaxID=335849 RepID=A0ABR1RZH0_9PEZI